MENFAREHRNKGYVEIAGRVFSTMSRDVEKQEGGTITEVVDLHGGSHTVSFIAVGCTIAVLLVIAVIIVMGGARMMEKDGHKGKEPFSNEH